MIGESKLMRNVASCSCSETPGISETAKAKKCHLGMESKS